MPRILALTTTLICAAMATFAAGCSSDDTAASGGNDVGILPDGAIGDASAATDSSPTEANAFADSSLADASAAADSGAAADSSAADSSESGDAIAEVGTAKCAPDSGTTITAKWDFAVSAVTDGGPGQLLTVHVCDSVLWINDDDGVAHSVVSTNASAFPFTTATVLGTAAGAPFAPIQFPVAGTFGYECGVHGSSMSGQITVTP